MSIISSLASNACQCVETDINKALSNLTQKANSGVSKLTDMVTNTLNTPFSKINNDTGFGSNANNYGGRFINRDGSFNLKKEGLPFWDRFSIYHNMQNLPAWKFIAVIVIFYFPFFILLLFSFFFNATATS